MVIAAAIGFNRLVGSRGIVVVMLSAIVAAYVGRVFLRRDTLA